MDRYTITFARLKKENRLGFCPFAVLGDPTPTQSLVRIKKYIAVKPDFLELGIPFSDPVADGPVIQAADERALASGLTTKKALTLIRKIRVMASKSAILRQAQHGVPIGILTYANIVLQYGISKFYKDLKTAGADSILIADVPLEEIAPFAHAAKKNKLNQIFIVSEYTNAVRLKKIEKLGSGFLYVVSTLGVTGTRKTLPKTLPALLRRLASQTHLPLMVGFGISSTEHLQELKKTAASSAVVGSALVQTRNFKLTETLHKFSRYFYDIPTKLK